jgi:hypothetical protein
MMPESPIAISVDLDLIRRNAERISHQVGMPVIAVVKSDAYGLGARRDLDAPFAPPGPISRIVASFFRKRGDEFGEYELVDLSMPFIPFDAQILHLRSKFLLPLFAIGIPVIPIPIRPVHGVSPK